MPVMIRLLAILSLLLCRHGVAAEQVIPLDGDWTIAGFDPQGTRRVSDLPGRVPGQVHPDLQRAGLISDPFWRDQADQCQWVEHWEWRYARTFQVPAGFPRRWAMLQFDGLDTVATILLNGKEAGRTDNMFIPHAFDIGAWLRDGANTIEVRFAPAVASVADKPHRKQFAVFDASGARTYLRRMQCGFGWDWVHRFVSAGIWRSCRIVSYADARIDDLFAWTGALGATQADLKLEVTSTIRNNAVERLHLVIADPEGRPVHESTVPAQPGTVRCDATIRDPRWWWPNGAGEHPLYRVCAELLDAQGRVLHRREVETGLRTVAIEERPDAEGSGRSFTLVVNGTRIFAKGGNWVPADPFPSRVTPDHYARLLGQARDAGMNMLRSWGGGIYEPEAFWRACDRMGLMVSQDFLLACADYPEQDEAFTAALKREFTTAVRLLRNHPSLVFWSGDNELGLNAGPKKDWSFKRFHEQVTTPMMRALDPSRPFRPTSPYGGDADNNSPLAGDCHRSSQLMDELSCSDMREYRRFIDQTTGRFMSEHATGGAPPKRSLLRFMTGTDLAGTAMWEYHSNDNPYIGRPQGLTICQVFQQGAERLYGASGGDTDRRIRQMEYVQYEFARLGMESARRRKFWCSGIQFWMLNDCWPAIGWSMVDYWGQRKASWYGQAAGCRPVIAAQEVTADAVRFWACNDQLKPADITLEVRVQPWTGAARWSKTLTLTVPANTSVMAVEMPLAEMKRSMGDDAALVCDLKHASGTDRSWWFPGLPSGMRPPAAGLAITQHRGEGEGVVTITAVNWARVVTLDADVDFSDNYFEMLPGETRTITWRAPERSFAGEIRVSCWNP